MFKKRNQKWFRFFYALMRMEVPVSGNETLFLAQVYCK